jgi:hypothetical protein
MKLEKKIITASASLDSPDIHSTLDAYVRYLEEIIVQYGPEAVIEDDAGYYESSRFIIHYEILESDEQLAFRQARHDKAEERKMNPSDKALAKAKRVADEKEAKRLHVEKQEKKLLETLKAKYEV